MQVSRRAQLRLAAVLWTVPGIVLSLVGGRWLLLHSSGLSLAILAVAALVLGVAKGRFVLSRSAARLCAQIDAKGDGARLGAFLGLKSLILLAVMILAGRLLRTSPMPRDILGALYLGIGAALLLASVIFWRARPPATS